MMKHTLAKLTRPGLRGVLPRERLFRWLDEQRDTRIVWVAAPPGAGKTALVASYIDARRMPSLWYQIDAGDADPATFFHYLGLAAQTASRSRTRKPLPALRPEYMFDIGAFARRFFRELYSRMPSNATLVFDNHHEVSDASFQWLLRQAFDEIPEHLKVIVISRSEPPVALARFSASRLIQLLDWEQLRFTLDETAAVAQAAKHVDAKLIELLHRCSGGWAAGLTLMLERVARSDTDLECVEAQAREAAFAYFAGEFFDRLPALDQQILTATAVLPYMTASLVEALTGNPQSIGVIDGLYRRHLFTDRRTGQDCTYHYHDLFRDFLVDRSRAVLPQLGLAQLSARAAELLANDGKIEAAIELYRAARNWMRVSELILQHAPTLLRQSRGQTLRDWIGSIPREHVEREPWLRYWLGSALIAVDQVQARNVLDGAYRDFLAGDDLSGQTACVWGIAESVNLEWSDAREMDRWIDIVQALLSRPIEFVSAEAELRAYAAAVTAFMRRRAHSPALVSYADRLHALLNHAAPPNARVAAAAVLLNYYSLCTDFPAARRLIAAIEPLCDEPDTSPLSHALWLGRVALVDILDGAYARALQSVAAAIAIARLHDLTGHLAFLYYMRHLALLSHGEARDIEKNMAQFEAAADPRRLLEMHAVSMAKLHLAVRFGHPERGLAFGRQAVAAADGAGFVAIQARSRFGLAGAYAECGLHSEATQLVSEARELVEGTVYRRMAYESELVLAYLALSRGDAEASHRPMRALFDATQSEGCISLGFLSNRIRARVFAEALRAGIAVDRVTELIRRYGIPPDESADASWPWTYKLFVLREFSIEKYGIAVIIRGKAKLTELLKLIVTAGGGSFSAATAAAILWPDVDGDVAARNLDTTLFRLRKLLGSDSVVRLHDGKLSIDAHAMWVDAWAFEQRAAACLRLPGANLIQHASSAMELYRSHFLEQDTDAAWAVLYRERLKARALELIQAAGTALEQTDAWNDAIAFYRQAIQLDPLAEGAYRGLMRCYIEQGEHAEAMNVYRRCRSTLSVVLGIQPSAETQALYATLQQSLPASVNESRMKVPPR